MSFLDDDRFQSFVRCTMEAAGVTGLSIAAVDTTKKEARRTAGFGAPTSGPVTSSSIFPICGSTKLFTVLGLAILVEQGKLQWTSRLVDVLPDLKPSEELGDLTLEQALLHQSGVLGHPEAELARDRKLSEVAAIASALRPSRRSTSTTNDPKEGLPPAHYTDIWYSVAGQIIAKISGKSYAAFVKEQILDPLEMYQTSFGKAFSGTNLVTPCLAMRSEEGGAAETFDIGHGFHTVPEDSICIPSGGILSNAEDMAKWLEYLVRLSKPGEQYEASETEKTIVEPETMHEILKGRCSVDRQLGALQVPDGTSLWEELLPAEYGLGVQLTEYRGVRIASCHGAGPGSASLVVWTPGRDFGIAILANVSDAAYGCAIGIALRALDCYLGMPELAWNERLLALPIQHLPAEPIRPPIPAKPVTSPKMNLLTGTYHDISYGTLYVVPFASTDWKAMPEEAGRTLRHIRQATCIGPAASDLDDPLLIGMLADRPIGGGYWAMYHVSGPTFWVHRHQLDTVYKEEKVGDAVLVKKRYVDIPDSGLTSLSFNPLGSRIVFSFREVDEGCHDQISEDGARNDASPAPAHAIELYHNWRDEDIGESQGDVTFQRKEEERPSARGGRLKSEMRVSTPPSSSTRARNGHDAAEEGKLPITKVRRGSSVSPVRMKIPVAM